MPSLTGVGAPVGDNSLIGDNSLSAATEARAKAINRRNHIFFFRISVAKNVPKDPDLLSESRMLLFLASLAAAVAAVTEQSRIVEVLELEERQHGEWLSLKFVRSSDGSPCAAPRVHTQVHKRESELLRREKGLAPHEDPARRESTLFATRGSRDVSRAESPGLLHFSDGSMNSTRARRALSLSLSLLCTQVRVRARRASRLRAGSVSAASAPLRAWSTETRESFCSFSFFQARRRRRHGHLKLSQRAVFL